MTINKFCYLVGIIHLYSQSHFLLSSILNIIHILYLIYIIKLPVLNICTILQIKENNDILFEY